MEEIFEGQGTLKSINYGEKYNVEYEVHFITSIKPGTIDTPPTSRTRAVVEIIRSTDGTTLPDGDYELREEGIYIKLNNTNDAWTVVDSHL